MSIPALRADDTAQTIIAYLKAVSREHRAARLGPENVDTLTAWLEHLEIEARAVTDVQAAVVALLSTTEGSDLVKILVRLSDRRGRASRAA